MILAFEAKTLNNAASLDFWVLHCPDTCYPIVTPLQQYTPVWNMILSILRSKMNLFTMEMILGSQNWQDYISNGYVYPSFKSDLCSDEVKIG